MWFSHFRGIERVCVIFSLFAAYILICTSCSTSSQSDIRTPQPAVLVSPTITDAWSSLLQKNAYPYNTPLPPPNPTLLDGTYTKFEQKEATPIPCRRCPDYMVEGGTWKLNLDRGTFRIFHEPTGWQGLGSFTIAADRLFLFNDPKCPHIVGNYKWQTQDEMLYLETSKDSCAANLRGHNLENLPWELQKTP